MHSVKHCSYLVLFNSHNNIWDLYCMWWGQHLNPVDCLGVGGGWYLLLFCITKLLVATPTCIGLNRGFASLYN